MHSGGIPLRFRAVAVMVRGSDPLHVHLVRLYQRKSLPEKGYRYLITTINSGQVSPACGIPMYYIQSAPLICFVVCAFRIVQRWFLEWHNFLQNDDLKMWPSKIHPENGSEK